MNATTNTTNTTKIEVTRDAFGTTIVSLGRRQVRIDGEFLAIAGTYEAYVDTFFPTRGGCSIRYKSLKSAIASAKRWLVKNA